jgi:riboflavin kinase/FMN adenylyltransferase
VTPLLHESVDEVPKGPRVVALGTFDGVHLGHRRVIAAAVERARALGIPAMVATFHPRPVTVLVPDRAPEALSTVGRRIELLGEAGADEVVVIRFDLELSSLEADEFCDEILSRRLGAQVVVTGADFHFGHARTGTPETLALAGAELGFETIAVPLFEHEGERVSSTRIRGLIASGDVQAAARLLGRSPEVEGTVIHGDARGRELGVPTANLALAAGHVLPAQGVYTGVAMLPDDAGLRRAAISVGTNPTFAGERELRIEAHLLDFEGDLYGRPLRLAFRRFLRGQVTFDGLEALERQMRDDIAQARDEPLADSRRITNP